MHYTKEQFISEVSAEAKALREHATDSERQNLDFFALDPGNIRKCIYGQMTGHCDSDRSIELIQKCTLRYFVDEMLTSIKIEGFDRIRLKANGSKVEDLRRKRVSAFSNYISHFSAIEAYILLPEAKNENLISYLKGETEIIDINF